MAELEFFDCLILDHIRRHGGLQDRELAQRMQCPRNLLLDRLEWLYQRGYLSVAPGPEEGGRPRYALTEAGRESCIPLTYFHKTPEALLLSQEEAFDWTGLYLPQPGWLDQ